MIVYEYEDNSVVEKEITEQQKSAVVSNIVSKWTEWSVPIKELKSKRDSVIKESKPKICDRSKKDWHSQIELNRPYEYYNKLYGLLYETFYDKISSYLKLGNVRHDAVYNRAFNIENKKHLLVCLKDMLDCGEIVASAELKNTYKKTVLPISEILSVENPNDIVSIKKNSFILREKTGEEINFVRINPCNFAYDPLVVPGTEEFDNCDKIVKQWKTTHEILSNKNYEISAEDMKEILDDKGVINQQSEDKSDVDEVVRSNQVEVLTYYGAFNISGSFYENYVAVVIGRKKLVYFKPKGIYTPGIYFFPYHAIGNGARGVSPLYYILDLCYSEQKTFNDAIDFLELQKNPPQYVPRGFFEDEITKIEPGKHIFYKMGMYEPDSLKPIVYNAQPLMLFQEATKQLEKEIGGIDSGQLSVKSEALTEEEVKRIASSENIIPNMIISGIMLHIISKYLKDCVQIIEGEEFDENVVKTAWEYANEQLQMTNVLALLEKVGSYDPAMPKIQESTAKALEIMGVNPDDYINNSKNKNIIGALGGMSEEILQQLFVIAQKLQIEENNREKAKIMMGQIQDSEYKSALKSAWKETGMLPESVIVPDGQGAMQVPVEAITPSTQVKNNKSNTVD